MCDIIEEAIKFYEELYCQPKEVEGLDAGRVARKNKSRTIQDMRNNEIFPQMLKHEIEITLKSLKTEKASRPDGIENEILKRSC